MLSKGYTPNAASVAIAKKVARDSQESVSRHLRRLWRRKLGAARLVEPAGETIPHFGLGVFYEVIERQIDSLGHQLNLPLPANKRQELVRLARAIDHALKKRAALLALVSPEDAARQLQALGLELLDLDPGAVLGEELEKIKGLEDSLFVLFAGSSLLHEFLETPPDLRL